MELHKQIEESAQRVYDELGPGLSERAYHNSLETEFSHRGIEFSSEGNFDIRYRGKAVAYRKPDLQVGEGDEIIVVELKAGSSRGEEQLDSYLRLGKDDANVSITGGMLISFNSDELKVVTKGFNTSNS